MAPAAMLELSATAHKARLRAAQCFSALSPSIG
jgi:hypothetical protein